MRRFRLAIALAALLVAGGAGPVDARPMAVMNMQISTPGVDCVFTYSASWSGLPGRVAAFELYILGPAGPTHLIHSGTADRSGAFGFNIILEGSGDTGGRLLFLDAAGRTVRTVDNEEGLVPVSC